MKLSTKHLICIIVALVSLAGALVYAFPDKISDKNYEKGKFIINHTKCNHNTSTPLTDKELNHSLKEIKSKYPEYEVNVKNNELTLTKTEDNYCDRHYFAYLKDNTITILRLNDGYIIRKIAISEKMFSNDELNSLKTGIMLFDTYELTSFIEDYSS